MEQLRGARQLSDIQYWLPDLNKLEDAINAASEPLGSRSKGAAQWDFIRAADYEDTRCKVREGGRLKTACRTFFLAAAARKGFAARPSAASAGAASTATPLP